MATIGNQQAKVKGFYGLPGNVQPELRKLWEAASQTFTVGRFLVLNGSGYVAVHASDNDASLIGVAAIAGANNASAGVVKSQFYPMTPWTLLEMNLLEASDAAHVLAQTDLDIAGVQYQTTSTFNTLDTATTTDRFIIVEIELEPTPTFGAIGDSNARVHACPLSATCWIGQ